MRLHQLVVEAAEKQRAGIVPFLSDGRCLFMVSSDPENHGGPDPSIAKGRVDGDEAAKLAAVREGEEELGLRKSNMAAEPFLGWSGEVTGLKSTYAMDVYAVLVKSETDFGETDKETARTVWLSRADFKKEGRQSHQPIMTKIFDKIDAYLKRK